MEGRAGASETSFNSQFPEDHPLPGVSICPTALLAVTVSASAFFPLASGNRLEVFSQLSHQHPFLIGPRFGHAALVLWTMALGLMSDQEGSCWEVARGLHEADIGRDLSQGLVHWPDET